MDVSGILPVLLIGSLVSLMVFLIAREAVCWYWKINEQIGHMEQIRKSLESIDRRLASAPLAATPSIVQTSGGKPGMQCPSCAKPLTSGNKFCEYCGARTRA